ncbi:MAG TPA: Uma2 family endonuclease [Gemmataceae bacterium]|nr:Uma2 family endonuclease [Gemmataceae bacterium]
MATVATPMTTEEMLAMPDNGMERWLIAGKLRERHPAKRNSFQNPMRNRFYSRIMACVTTELELWLRQQPAPRGQVLCGEAGCRLRHEPDTTVGIDVVYVSADVVIQQTGETSLIDGVPTLAVEILSPNDTVEEIHEKTTTYRVAGVPLVWVLDPYNRTVMVHRPDAEPEMFNSHHELSGEPHLPGFRVPVARLFE